MRGTAAAMTGRIGLACGAMPEGRCLAGFSGGADSTALMYLLAEAMREGRTQPEAVHVNHGIRGAEADGDEAFCRRVCEELGIPFHGARAELHGRTDENACREARFRAFRETMEATGIRQLVLAHNRDDLAETFLMRLMRGAGTEGLACMSPKDARDGYTILRPMLENGRAEIREALKAAGIPWREDSTNANEGYLRNSVRGKLIPLMEQMSPGAAGRIAAAAGILTAENGELQRQADEFLARHSRGEWLDADALKQLMALLRRFAAEASAPDLVVCNYVYEHVADNTERIVCYANALPMDRPFGWSEVGRLSATQFITMHAAISRPHKKARDP